MIKNINKLPLYLECKDHMVSNKTFQLLYNQKYDMLVTSPQPPIESLSQYYESKSYISHTDSKKTFLDKIYHTVKNFAIYNKVNLITKINNGKGSVLDIGAGTGDFLYKASQNKWIIAGTEPSDLARTHAKDKGISLFLSTNELKSKQYDIVTMWHVLEHVSDLNELIFEIKRLLKPNGHLVIALPNFKSYDALQYKEYWAAFDVPRHFWHFSRTTVNKLFLEKGFTLLDTLPMIFDAFYVSLLSEKYKNGKINYFKAFWTGFLSNLNYLKTKECSSHIYVLKKQ